MGGASEGPDRHASADAEGLVGRGLDWLRKGETGRAIEELDAALRHEPENARALFERGQAWLAKGEYARALEDFNEAVRLRPEDSNYLGHRASTRHHLGDLVGAVADFDRAINGAPRVTWLYGGRAAALHADDDIDAALADYNRAIALDPNDCQPFLSRGMALATIGECEEAIASYTEAIRLNPANALSYLYRAEARCQVEEFEAAVVDFGEAIRLDPDQARAYRGRAVAREALEQDEEAEADYRQVERLGDDEPMGGATVAVTERKPQIHALIQGHFDPTPVEDLTITERDFPHRVRADLQRAADRVFAEEVTVLFFCGVRKSHAFEGISLTELLVRDRNNPAQSVPPLYEEVDVGEVEAVRCLKNGLWLLEADGIRYAVFLEQHLQFHQVQGVRIQVASPNDPRGFRISQSFLNRLDEAIQKAESYRGKILSLEKGERFSGKSSGILVHRLSTVERDQVILPASTLELLERNVVRFVGLRPKLNTLGLATKKGLLFYGPPGTGKTHTIHYLAGSLKGHTTLLITAEQVGLLAEYMALARLLQPSMVVIEDVDLIARDRTTMGSPCEEVLLNKLLNEMDGLRPDAEILFVLTTNRPEALEAALASRPGRVDQAIEFPLPDDEGRTKLVRLYARGVEVPEDVVRETVKRTEGVSASFIKELMRRSTQFHLERADSGRAELQDVEAALDELLFTGGSLNRKLLGGNVEASEARPGRS
jgi:tetratricopeptide (TPR) repeat protein